MISRKKKHVLRSVLTIAICAVTIASTTTRVYSAPSTSSLKNKTSDLQNELDDLNSQLTALSKELDSASEQVEELSAEIEKSKLDLASAQLNEELQYESMKDRIQFMYEGGNVSLIQILFSSEDMSDFLNKAEYVTTISEYDRSMLEELKEARINVENKQKELTEQQDELTKLEAELTEKQDELTSRISSTSSELADYKEQLERAKAAEEALKNAQDESSSGPVTPSNENNSSSGSTKNDGSQSKPSVPASTSDVALFAAILQCEAGGYDGMLAVATVIMNRVESSLYPNTLKEVIYQPGQFAPTWNGSLNRVLATGATATAYTVAQDALAGARHSAVINCYQFRSASTGVSGINVAGNVFF